jgi:mannose/fructose-specific phosphotransferase system component IIA
VNRVGVAIVGHGNTASQLLAAARGIVRSDVLADVIAIDAGEGETQRFSDQMCGVIEKIDEGRGVVVFVDLLGASPCQCVRREGLGHGVVTLSGLNLAMILKLALLDRERLSAAEVAEACADSAQRSVKVTVDSEEEMGS